MDDLAKPNGVRRIALTVIATLLASSLIRSLLFAAFVIPSQSMMDGLVTGDFFIASKWDYGWSRYSFGARAPRFRGRVMGSLPSVGDVVVFSGVWDPRITYVKRVMGLPGDVVEMRAGRFIINGRVLPQRRLSDFILPLGPNVICLAIPGLIDLRTLTADARPGCRFRRFEEMLPDGRAHTVLDFAITYSDTFPAVRVPAGHLFMMGDNRDDSLDSRIAPEKGGLGMVPIDRVTGKARRIFFSSDGTGSFLRPWTWQEAFRPERIGPVR